MEAARSHGNAKQCHFHTTPNMPTKWTTDSPHREPGNPACCRAAHSTEPVLSKCHRQNTSQNVSVYHSRTPQSNWTTVLWTSSGTAACCTPGNAPTQGIGSHHSMQVPKCSELGIGCHHCMVRYMKTMKTTPRRCKRRGTGGCDKARDEPILTGKAIRHAQLSPKWFANANACHHRTMPNMGTILTTHQPCNLGGNRERYKTETESKMDRVPRQKQARRELYAIESDVHVRMERNSATNLTNR